MYTYRVRRPAWFALNEPRHYLILVGILAAVCLVIGGVRWTMDAPERAKQEQEHQRQVEESKQVGKLYDACMSGGRWIC